MTRTILYALLLVFGTAMFPGASHAQNDRSGSGLANPSVGMGLNSVTDWTTQLPFIDVMKMSRTWIGHRPGQWGGMEWDELKERGYLDEDGWLKAIPEGIEKVSVLMLTDLPPDAVSANGRYRLTYKGQGSLTVQGNVRNLKRVGNDFWFDFTAGPGFAEVVVKRTDPHKTGDYIRDISVVKEENIPLFEAGVLFNPAWIKLIQDQRLVRFMDWMQTNNSQISQWDDRPKVNDVTYTRVGVPVEIMVALANQIGADPWFTLPHLATDDYMRRFAEYVRDNLDRKLKAHVEFSNEVWNWSFQQAQWADTEGKKRWGEKSQWVEYYGMRAAQMVRIWNEVFGDEADARLVRVIATHTGWIGLEEGILETPLWVAEDPANNRPAASYFDAYAVTGYFSGGLGEEPKASMVKKWIADSRAAAQAEAERQNLAGPARTAYVNEHAYDKAVELAEQELRDGSISGDKPNSLFELANTIFPYHSSVARKYGLNLIMYEGGTHIVGLNEQVNDPELTAFFTHLNYTEEMGELYKTLLSIWKKAGGTMFNAFVDVANPSKWGSWGALRYLTDKNPRWDALAAFNAETPGWWETRDADTFLHGVTKFAAARGERLEGTAKADILIGGDGDDTLISHGGADRINGGAGTDTAILPGRFDDYAFARKGDRVTATVGSIVTILFSIETIHFSEDPDRKLQAIEISE